MGNRTPSDLLPFPLLCACSCCRPMNRVRVENVHDAQMELQQQSHNALEDRHRTSAGDVTPSHRSRLRQGSASIT
jgi:hypothetical protein